MKNHINIANYKEPNLRRVQFTTKDDFFKNELVVKIFYNKIV